MKHKFLDIDEETDYATRITEVAMAEAVDAATEAGISGECFLIAVLNHICQALVDQFQQTPDDISALANWLAAAYVGAPERVLH